MSTTITSKCHPCSVCEGLDHHWLEECDDDHPLGIMACKHCPATRAIVDADYEAPESTEASVGHDEAATILLHLSDSYDRISRVEAECRAVKESIRTLQVHVLRWRGKD